MWNHIHPPPSSPPLFSITNSWGLHSLPLALPDVVFTCLVVCNTLPYVRQNYPTWMLFSVGVIALVHSKLNERWRKRGEKEIICLKWLFLWQSCFTRWAEERDRGEGRGRHAGKSSVRFKLTTREAPAELPWCFQSTVDKWIISLQIESPPPLCAENSLINIDQEIKRQSVDLRLFILFTHLFQFRVTGARTSRIHGMEDRSISWIGWHTYVNAVYVEYAWT